MAAIATPAEEQLAEVPLRLLVDKEKNCVLFAEAGKDFVDVLLSFLTLPLGTIVRLVGKESDMQPVKVGSLSSLYQSVANLDKERLCTETCKEMLLQPRNSAEDYCRNLKLNIDDTETKYFTCVNLDCRGNRLSTLENERCSCGKLLAQPIPPTSDKNGFVNGNATFIITDDLIVMPNSLQLDTRFSLIKNRGIDNICSVHEMTVNVTQKQVLDLLKCSLLSKTTLTDLFLQKKPFLERFELPRLSPCEFVANGSSSQINVRLMLRKSNGKIVFARGEEDFADFLFSLLTFPLGGVVRMLEGYSSMGSVDGLYKSVADLKVSRYLMTEEEKNKLVDPRLAPQFRLSKQMLPIQESQSSIYCCFFDESRGFKGSILNNECDISSHFRDYDDSRETYKFLNLVLPKSSEGYAKGPTMFMVTDDLAVSPTSPISGVSLLSSLNIPLSDLEEKAVSIGIKEGLSILKASLTSTSALTIGLSHLLTTFKEEEAI